jgi:hypothetical protein
MPQLKKFQDAGAHKYARGDREEAAIGKEQEDGETPEDLIEHTA